MTSTDRPACHADAAQWRAAGHRYYRLSSFCRQKFGRPVRKISLDGGFGCPNVDGTVGAGGCIFCNVRSFSPSCREAVGSIAEQIEHASARLRRRYGADRFVAYFQPATNTHAPVETLRAAFEEALAQPDVVGLAVGTRPDCAGDGVLDLLAELAGRTWLVVEFGLQTIHERTLRWMNRGHGYDAFLDAVRQSHSRGLAVGAHVILGLPGEGRHDMIATARELARLGVHSVKLHNLYVSPDTVLAERYAAGEVPLSTRVEYAGYVADFLEHLHPQCVIDRTSADAPPEYVIAPAWCLDKHAVRRAIEAELERRNTWQGRRLRVPGGPFFPGGLAPPVP